MLTTNGKIDSPVMVFVPPRRYLAPRSGISSLLSSTSPRSPLARFVFVKRRILNFCRCAQDKSVKRVKPGHPTSLHCFGAGSSSLYLDCFTGLTEQFLGRYLRRATFTNFIAVQAAFMCAIKYCCK